MIALIALMGAASILCVLVYLCMSETFYRRANAPAYRLEARTDAAGRNWYRPQYRSLGTWHVYNNDGIGIIQKKEEEAAMNVIVDVILEYRRKQAKERDGQIVSTTYRDVTTEVMRKVNNT